MFELFEHTADVGIRVKGSSLEEVFSDAGKALFSVMTDLEQVDCSKRVDIIVKASSLENLFVNYLNELIFQKDVNNFFFCKFDVYEVKQGNGFELKAGIFGEPINSKKHVLLTEVKGATFSQLRFEKQGNEYIAQCILDV